MIIAHGALFGLILGIALIAFMSWLDARGNK